MAITDLADLKDRLTGDARVMGLDLGSKGIGLALSDVGRQVATPLAVLKRTKFTADASALFRLIDEHGVGGLVLGLPVSMDGSEGPRCQSTRQFARNLMSVRDLPLAFWDERLSTVAVERVLLDEADLTRRRRAELIDKMAAAYILQGALDAR